MSEQDEFFKWLEDWSKRHPIETPTSLEIWQACAEQKNKIIEQQVSALEALSRFSKMAIMTGQYGVSHEWLIQVVKANNLLDENNQATTLLTGEWKNE